MRYRYEVDENNTLRIWDLEQPNHDGSPIILQPDFPDATPWTREQAEEWAEDWIEMMTNPEFQFYPKEGPLSERISRRSS
jgi:hypothetical protein